MPAGSRRPIGRGSEEAHSHTEAERGEEVIFMVINAEKVVPAPQIVKAG